MDKEMSGFVSNRQIYGKRYDKHHSKYSIRPLAAYPVITRFLMSKVGQSWDSIWSEICAKYPKTERGLATREAFHRQVHTSGPCPYLWGFSLSKSGQLQYTPRPKYEKSSPSEGFIRISDTEVLIKGSMVPSANRDPDTWFRCELRKAQRTFYTRTVGEHTYTYYYRDAFFKQQIRHSLWSHLNKLYGQPLTYCTRVINTLSKKEKQHYGLI